MREVQYFHGYAYTVSVLVLPTLGTSLSHYISLGSHHKVKVVNSYSSAIRRHLLPAITAKTDISDMERELIVLPACLGGLSIPNSTITLPTEHNALVGSTPC